MQIKLAGPALLVTSLFFGTSAVSQHGLTVSAKQTQANRAGQDDRAGGVQTRGVELPDLPGTASTPETSFSSSETSLSPSSAAAIPGDGGKLDLHELSKNGRNPFPNEIHPRGFHLPPLALTAKLGTTGGGAEVATPLGPRANLRVGAQFLEHPTTFSAYGVDTDVKISLQNVYTAVDLYPFKNSFHISPGLMVHGDNHVTSAFTVPGGHSISLGDGEYTSDPTDPIRGTGMIRVGGKVAPRLTAGWGNVFPRSGGRLSFPFEVGFQVSTAPTVAMTLTGSACDAEGNCGKINSGTGVQDIQREIQSLQDTLSPLRLYPIASFGISFNFGHAANRAK